MLLPLKGEATRARRERVGVHQAKKLGRAAPRRSPSPTLPAGEGEDAPMMQIEGIERWLGIR